VSAWRTEAHRYLRVREDAATYHVTVDDQASRFFECPTLQPTLPPLRPDQQAAVQAWERAAGCGVVIKVDRCFPRRTVFITGPGPAGRSLLIDCRTTPCRT
jgi:hypothetical protein